MKNLEQTVNEIVDKALEGYKVMPPMDKDKYPEMPGLEGPFTLMSGKVVYYDPKEGAYYDKDTDMYMSYDEFQQHDNDYSNMKDERDDVKEVDKSAIDAAVAQAMSGAPQSSPRPKARPKRMPRPKARPTINIGSNPVTGATRGIDPKDNYSPEDLKRLLMQSATVRRDGKTLSKSEIAKLQRQGVLMKEGARGLGSIDWPEEEMMQTATDAIRYGYSKNDSFSHLYSMYGDDHGKWLRANEDMILDVFSQYMDESISEDEEEGMIIYVGDQKFEYSDYTIQDAMYVVDEYADEMEGEPYEVYNADGELVASGTMRSGAFHEPGIEEGKSPHKKGTKKYKAHMAAMHANSVDLNAMRDALKLDESTDANTVVAQYTRACLDHRHNTWGKVCEEINHVRSFVKEDIDIENVKIQIRKMHEQENLDYAIQIKENVNKLRQIVKDQSAMSIKFADGSMKVDMTTASIFLQVFDKVKEETQAKIIDKIQTKAGFLSILELMYKKIG